MTPAALGRHRQRLIELRDEIVREGDIAIDPVRTDATGGDGDEDAQPLAEMSQVIASKRNISRTGVLARVRQALARIESAPDRFGLCAECDEPIGKRLMLLPYVELCIECQAARDDEQAAARSGPRRHLRDFG